MVGVALGLEYEYVVGALIWGGCGIGGSYTWWVWHWGLLYVVGVALVALIRGGCGRRAAHNTEIQQINFMLYVSTPLITIPLYRSLIHTHSYLDCASADGAAWSLTSARGGCAAAIDDLLVPRQGSVC